MLGGGEQDGGGLVLINRVMVACFYAHSLQSHGCLQWVQIWPYKCTVRNIQPWPSHDTNMLPVEIKAWLAFCVTTLNLGLCIYS